MKKITIRTGIELKRKDIDNLNELRFRFEVNQDNDTRIVFGGINKATREISFSGVDFWSLKTYAEMIKTKQETLAKALFNLVSGELLILDGYKLVLEEQ